jgi:hypothetical protein
LRVKVQAAQVLHVTQRYYQQYHEAEHRARLDEEQEFQHLSLLQFTPRLPLQRN